MSPGRRRRRPGRPWSRYRPVDAIRAIWGLSALAAPDRVVRLFGAGAHPRAARRTARILGLRDVVQATCLPAGPVERPHRLGAMVDAVHVATMLALAAVSRSWRRPALTSASVSALLVLLGRQDSQPRDRAASSNRPSDHDESDVRRCRRSRSLGLHRLDAGRARRTGTARGRAGRPRPGRAAEPTHRPRRRTAP